MIFNQTFMLCPILLSAVSVKHIENASNVVYKYISFIIIIVLIIIRPHYL